jgi:hypothetical protein
MHGRCSAAAPLPRGALAVLLVLFAACGEGAEPRPDDPPTAFPMLVGPVSPSTAYWGTPGVQFVISGGTDLLGRSFRARLEDAWCSFPDLCWAVDCPSATVDSADPSKLNVVCDIPDGGPYPRLKLNVLYEDAWIFDYYGFQHSIWVEWPPSEGAASFSSTSASALTWGTKDARLRVSGGANLPGHALTAALDDLPCGSVQVTSEDPGILVMYCSTRPGNGRGTARLAIQEHGVTIPGGELAVDVVACRDSGPADDGVPLPLLCNAPPGSTAAVSTGLEGVWRHSSGTPAGFALFAPDGRFMTTSLGGEWTASGLTWTASPPLTVSGSYVPFRVVSPPGSDLYSPANALLVSQNGAPGTVGVAGTWGTSHASPTLTVDATGAFTGTTNDLYRGTCSITGTITAIDPPKNILSVSMVASGGNDCHLHSSPLTGLGFIDAEVLPGPWPGAPYAMQYTLFFRVHSAERAPTFFGAARP